MKTYNPDADHLLAALKELKGWIKHWTDDRNCNLLPTEESLEQANAAIDTAIDKATGGAA